VSLSVILAPSSSLSSPSTRDAIGDLELGRDEERCEDDAFNLEGTADGMAD
jgi:hypothetical protein